jgi:hypothetical protein
VGSSSSTVPGHDWTEAPWSSIAEAVVVPEPQPDDDILVRRVVAGEAPPRLELRPRSEWQPRRTRGAPRFGAIAALLGTVLIVIFVGATHIGARGSPAHADISAGVTGARVRSGRGPKASGPYPSVTSMERAAAYLQTRTGRTAFAVVDSSGRELGLNAHSHFLSASVVKAMLLVAYLRRLAARHEQVGSPSQALLYPMIHVSDNHAASATWRIVGDDGLEDVARRAGMVDFELGPDWANEEISAADQARFFFGMDSLIPPQFRAYARSLLSAVDPSQSWGIPAAARPAWRVFFKGGWRGTYEGQLVTQIARLQRGARQIAIAVMTVSDPSMEYGEETIEGVAARLLTARPPDD